MIVALGSRASALLKRSVLAALSVALLAGLALAYARMGDDPAKQNPAQRAAAIKRSRIFYDFHQFRRVSFVVHIDIGMMDKFWPMSADLRNVVDLLSPLQSFDIEYFGNGYYGLASSDPRCPASELLAATPENKHWASQFLDGFSTTGYRDPTDAIESAFRRKADVIYVLTDSDFAEKDAVIRKIRELNKQKRVSIYTIAFVGKKDSDMSYVKVLKKIAAENRGRFRYVRAWELR